MKLRYKDYLAQHTTRGCKITHIIGIPLILAAIGVWIHMLILKVFCFPEFIAGTCFMYFGLAYQGIGHYYFEKNNPAFISSPKALIYGIMFLFDPQTYIGLFKK